jgi:hypothetical protein
MKVAILSVSLLAGLPYAVADDAKPRASRLPAGCEVVMSPGMRITAATIAITAVDELGTETGTRSVLSMSLSSGLP